MINFYLVALIPFVQTGIDPNRFNDFLVLAYVVMGVIGLLYVASLVVRQRNLEKDIELMQQLLREDEETAEP